MTASKAAKRLAEHKADLDKLGKRIQSKRAALVDKEDEQAAAITRLSEELARAQILTREKRARLQAATRAREEERRRHQRVALSSVVASLFLRPSSMFLDHGSS